LPDFEIWNKLFVSSEWDIDELSKINAKSVEQRYKKGENIYFEGEIPRWLKVVKMGKVKIFKTSPSGQETILRILGPGEGMGVGPVIDGRPFCSSAVALEPVVLFKTPRLAFLEAVKNRPDLFFKILLDLAHRLCDAQELIRGLASERVEKRIVNLLLKLADRIGKTEDGRVRIPVTLTRQDIADMVGSTVETTIRVLSRFSREGIMETQGKTIIINDIERLKSQIEQT